MSSLIVNNFVTNRHYSSLISPLIVTNSANLTSHENKPNIPAAVMISTTSQHVHGHHNGSAVVPHHNNVGLNIIKAAAMDETYGTYVDDECVYIQG